MTETLPAPAAETKTPLTVHTCVEAYVRCRAALKVAEEKHKEDTKELTDLQKMLTGWLQRYMDKEGADSIKTVHGTCYTTTTYSASLADSEAFMKFVIATQAFEMLDRKANVTAVRAYVDEHDCLPPGVNLSSIANVRVRGPGSST